jgi:putative ubiquitin-RnfH superfamily antitoxin RatB of RatAB toxin-antitoxin module|tara:strand:- start:19337 stop:19666 length:330 start_codon:yes stop_codon:yes gene_type:complete
MADAMSNDTTITVEVAYALPHKQALLALKLPLGTTALEAAQQSGITNKFDGVDLDDATLGIFGHVVAPGHVLREGDRVEVYRPLIADPKEVRKARAERAKARREHDKAG